MTIPRPTFLLACLLLGGSLPVGLLAAENALPPLTGDLGGEVTPLMIPGLPPIKWKATLRQGATAAERIVELAGQATGVRARVELRLTAVGEGAWRLIESEIDAAHWFALLAPKFFPALGDAKVEGTLALTGEGTLHEGKFAGRAQVELRNGSVQDAANTWSVKGIALRGTLRQLPALVTEGPVKLTFTEATFAGLTARDGAIELALDANGSVQVGRATAAMLDGHVEVTPFAFLLAKPALQADVHFKTIEIERLAAFLPPVLADATGKVSGRMALSWSAAEGLNPGSGRLQIDPDSSAIVRMSPQPGFFTSRVPKQLTLVPKSLGLLSRLFSPPNPAYETLRAIEMGELTLEMNSLDVALRPEGDPEGRTARVVLIARPVAEGTAVKSVRFEINVSGPLADLLRLGLQGKIDVHLNK